MRKLVLRMDICEVLVNGYSRYVKWYLAPTHTLPVGRFWEGQRGGMRGFRWNKQKDANM